MEFKKQLITPSYAKELLESNIKNRRIKSPVVARYSQDIINGKWKDDTAEVIKISKTGIILDGQHRLLAVIKANMPVYFHIAYGVEDSVIDVLDTGSLRNAPDIFKIEGIKNENVIPSIISTYHLLRSGLMVRGTSKNNRLTNAELLSEYLKNDLFWQSVGHKAVIWYKSFAKILPPSTLGGTFAFLKEISEDDAELFLNQLSTGMDVSNNVILLLRQKLMQDRMSPRKMSPVSRQALVIKAWNLFRKNEVVKLLKLDMEREGFPHAI